MNRAVGAVTTPCAARATKKKRTICRRRASWIAAAGVGGCKGERTEDSDDGLASGGHWRFATERKWIQDYVCERHQRHDLGSVSIKSAFRLFQNLKLSFMTPDRSKVARVAAAAAAPDEGDADAQAPRRLEPIHGHESFARFADRHSGREDSSVRCTSYSLYNIVLCDMCKNSKNSVRMFTIIKSKIIPV